MIKLEVKGIEEEDNIINIGADYEDDNNTQLAEFIVGIVDLINKCNMIHGTTYERITKILDDYFKESEGEENE